MDIKKLQTILQAKGIRVADDDPIFALVAFNEIILDEMSHKHQLAFREIDKKVIGELSAIVNQTVSQIAGKEAEAKTLVATTQKMMWVIGGGLAGLVMFGMGVSYGAIYSSWARPAWIDRHGLLSVLSTSLLNAPVGGVGCIVIALTLIFLQQNIIESVAENEEDSQVMKILVYLSAAVFAAMGFWLSFLVMF